MRNPDAFLLLMEKIEDQGGVHLPDVCEGSTYALDMPSAMTKAGHKSRRFTTTTCRQDARFLIPYISEDDSSQNVIVCANDDLVTRWPRFEENV